MQYQAAAVRQVTVQCSEGGHESESGHGKARMLRVWAASRRSSSGGVAVRKCRAASVEAPAARCHAAAAAVRTPLLAVRARHLRCTMAVCPGECPCQAAVLLQCASAVQRQ